jgi:formylglycine-generating enzyme required for sulfatase activity
MHKRAWMWIGGWCLAAGLLAGLAGCRRPISDIADLVVTLGPETKMRFVYIPALKQYVGKYEVSNKEYRCCKPSHNSGEHQHMTLNLDDQPVANVSWNDASAFCDWLTKTCGNNGAKHYHFRLPKEQEWETFAACGQQVEYPWGNGPIPSNWNYFGTENPESGQKLDHNDGYRVSCPVRKSGANAWGLYGVGGNVWEWCEDADDAEGKTRVLKGASWADCAPMFLKISRRSSYTKDYTSSTIGFRVIAEPMTNASKTQDVPTQTKPAKPEAAP